MNYSNDKKREDKEKREFERMERYKKQDAIDYAQKAETEQRKSMQNKYKEMLDNQRRIKGDYKAYGNMTKVEKALNRNDLIAWKNYDYTTYAMIPGINSDTLKLSNKVEGEKGLHPKQRNIEKEQQRLNVYHTNLNSIRNDKAHMVSPISNDYDPSHTIIPSDSAPIQDERGVRTNSEPRRNLSLGGGKRNLSLDGPRSGPSTAFRANHPKYIQHHLYSSLDPINGTLYESKHGLGKSMTYGNINHGNAF